MVTLLIAWAVVVGIYMVSTVNPKPKQLVK